MTVKTTKKRGGGVTFAATLKIDKRPEELARLLLMIGEYMGWNGDISHVFVSDWSTLGDFGLDRTEVSAIGRKIGFKVKNSDHLHEIVEKMVSA